MKRVIVEYAKLTKDILDMLIDKYPDGYDYNDIISFKNAKGETIKAIEVKTEDTNYLVKISDKLENAMEEYAEDEESFDDNDDFDVNDIEDED
jgi:DNA-directed RNA polymerase subunit delta